MTVPTPESAPDPVIPDAAQHEDATDWKAEARKWEARAKANNTKAGESDERYQRTLDAIASALGLKEAATPEQLTSQLTETQQAARAKDVQLAVLRRSGQLGANPDALLDSASFLAAAQAIDPADPDAVDQAIRAADEHNPALAASTQPAPGAGWSDAVAGRNTPPINDSDAEALRVLGF